jgi:glucose/arabinose dehydrogenase
MIIAALVLAAAALQHHEVRPDRLPKPFHTESAGNPPRLIKRPAGAQLIVPPGFKVEVWADQIGDPRTMTLAPNGDVFVADMANGKIYVFRNNGKERFTFAENLTEPFGLAFRGGHLYVGNSNAVVRFAYKPGQTAAAGKPEQLLALPSEGHSTRNVIFNKAGTKMYVAVGSASNVNDESAEPMRAAIVEFNPDGTGKTIYAAGLRNPIGLAWHPTTGALWTTVNERDGLGDDLVPDYITEVRRGAFYGWPFSYIGKNEDPRRKGERPDLVKKAVVPSLLLQSHSAPIHMVFYDGKMFPAKYRGGAFVALHGSWNRKLRTGYKVVHVPFKNGKPVGGYDDFVEGWAPDPAEKAVWGRPAGLLVLKDGSLLISDDGGFLIWRVSYAK